MDRLKAMEVFIQIVDRGSMSRAAAALGISTTTVSAYLSHLEGHLGRRLLDRSTRRIDLTQEGRRFLDDARHIVEAVALAEDGAASQSARPRGRVRIDVPALIGHRYILPALPDFLAEFPEIAIEMSFGDRASVFRPDGFDILVRVGEVDTAGVDVLRLQRTRYVYVACPDYLARRGTPSTPKDLEAHDCIVYSTVDQPGGRWWTFEHGGITDRVRPPSRLSLNDGTAILNGAVAGLGVAKMLEMLVMREIADGSLVEVLADCKDQPVVLSAMIAQDRGRLPAVTAAMAFLQAIDWDGQDPVRQVAE